MTARDLPKPPPPMPARCDDCEAPTVELVWIFGRWLCFYCGLEEEYERSRT